MPTRKTFDSFWLQAKNKKRTNQTFFFTACKDNKNPAGFQRFWSRRDMGSFYLASATVSKLKTLALPRSYQLPVKATFLPAKGARASLAPL